MPGQNYRRTPKKKKRRINKRRLRQLIFRLFAFTVLVAAGILVFQFFSFRKEITMEAAKGNAFDPASVSRFHSNPVRAGKEEHDLSVPGTYYYKVKVGLFTHEVKVVVTDTTAPVVNVESVTVTLGTKVDPQKCVSKIEDASKVTVTLKSEPDTTKIGKQSVILVCTDAAGNTTEKEVELLVSPFKDELTVEAGSAKLDAEDLAVTEIDPSLIQSEGTIETKHVGDQELAIQYDGYNFISLVHVVDTTDPEIEVQDLVTYKTAKLTGMEFVKTMKDATDIKATFDTEPDMTSSEVQHLQITFTDEGNNSVTGFVNLTLSEDTEAPHIACPDEHTISVGESIIFSDLVTVTDNCLDQYTLDIEKGTLDVNTEGTYPVKFTATDAAGNSTTREMNIIVIVSAYTQEQVDELADVVLNQIIDDSMSQAEQCRAIYNWIHDNIRYINHSDKGDWKKAAYEGLKNREGDCYVFAMTGKELLTRAGIKNMDIEKIPAKSRHYWSLVDIGDGWLHFDSCPRVVWHDFCLITDAELMEYSNANNLSHNYDKSKYPKVN